MSLPTYIRKRRIPNPVDFLVEHYANRGQRLDRPEANQMVQLFRKWERDYEGFYINPTKRHVRPFWLVPSRTDEIEVTLAAAGAAGDQARNIEFQIDTTGHFEISETMFQSTSPEFLVEIFDGGNNLAGFQNREVHARTMASNARRPFKWPESLFLNVQDAKRSIFVNLRNLSTSSNTVRFLFHGRRWYHKEAPPNVQRAIEERFMRTEKTYTYFLTVEPTSPGGRPPDIVLTPNQTLRENSAPNFKADDAADTEIYKLTQRATFADGSDGAYTFALRELQSGRILSNGRVHVQDGWGDAEFPMVLPETLLFERNYQMAFEVTNLSGAQNLTIFPTLTGRRLQYA